VHEQQSFFKSTVVDELTPGKSKAMLRALELLVAPDVHVRRRGLERLLALDAQRRSPLGAAVLAQRIVEPDLALRREIIRGLAKALRVDQEGKRSSERVRRWLRYTLGGMQLREISSLLEVVCRYHEDLMMVCCVVNACSSAGDTLVQILLDRRLDLTLRLAATEVVGEVGFLDAEPALESLLQRIAAQQAGQLEMGFSHAQTRETDVLVSAVRTALNTLREAAI
jgi:hypothetical protein